MRKKEKLRFLKNIKPKIKIKKMLVVINVLSFDFVTNVFLI